MHYLLRMIGGLFFTFFLSHDFESIPQVLLFLLPYKLSRKVQLLRA